MALSVSITEDMITSAVGDFVEAALGVPVVVGQVNRVPQPEGDSVVIWPLRRDRLATNANSSVDCQFEASIAAAIDPDPSVMTVSSVVKGSIAPGRTVFGVGVQLGTQVIAQLSGPPGGAGTYSVSIDQDVAEEVMAAGAQGIMQETEYVMQMDVHGANSPNLAQILSTIMRDGYSVDALASSGVVPLYPEDPRQVPFSPASDQYEDRWIVIMHFQINPVVTIDQQFASAVEVDLYDVDHPPED